MIKKFIDLMCFFFILSVYLFDNSTSLVFITNISFALFCASIILKKIMYKENFIYNSFLIEFYLILIILGISFINAPDINRFINGILVITKIFIMCFFIVNYINNDIDNIRKMIKYIAISGLILSLYFFILSYKEILTTDFSQGHTRFGREIGNENVIGLLCSISISIYIYSFMRSKKIINLIPIISMLSMILLTGSRKNILLLIISATILLYLENKKSLKGLLKIGIFSAILIIIVLYLIFNVEVFYNVIGVRIEQFIEVLLFGGELSKSDELRSYMMKFGIQQFFNKPILGYGIDGYAVLLNNDIGIKLYSHNNFVELLVTGGIIGFIVYYGVYLKLLASLLKNKLNYSKPLFSILFGIFIISYTQVILKIKIFYILLSIASVLIYIENNRLYLNMSSNEREEGRFAISSVTR